MAAFMTTICYLSNQHFSFLTVQGPAPEVTMAPFDWSDWTKHRFNYKLYTGLAPCTVGAVLETSYQGGSQPRHLSLTDHDVTSQGGSLPVPMTTSDPRFMCVEKSSGNGYSMYSTTPRDDVCSSASDVFLTSSPCWFHCWPNVEILLSRRQRRVRLRGANGGFLYAPARPSRYIPKSDYNEFEMQLYSYRIAKRTFTAVTLYNRASRTYLSSAPWRAGTGSRPVVPVPRSKKTVYSKKAKDLPKEFAPPVADERFFIMEKSSGKTITFRSHEDPGRFLAIRAGGHGRPVLGQEADGGVSIKFIVEEVRDDAPITRPTRPPFFYPITRYPCDWRGRQIPLRRPGSHDFKIKPLPPC